ncbi:MAG: glycerophosphoryl diester phosphodiesterase [Geminicoccaceae bacterium]|nr:glycerophosphoryl diester phosphodiesterase [Geminicoccaceae bacterium]
MDGTVATPPRAALKARLPLVVGHRGARAAAPENTLAGVREAHGQGARWVEVDVKLSRDGVPFLLHDDTLDRTTTGRGRARTYAMADLKAFDAGAFLGPAFAGERLPTLAELVSLLAGLDMGLNLEIKPCRGLEAETAERAVAVLRETWPKDRPWPLLSSFSPKSLEAAASVAPDMPRGLIADRLPRDWRRIVADLRLQTLHLGHEDLKPGQLAMLAGEGIPVLLWTVNDPIRATALLAEGAAAIITDRPGAVLAAIDAAPP